MRKKKGGIEIDDKKMNEIYNLGEVYIYIRGDE